MGRRLHQFLRVFATSTFRSSSLENRDRIIKEIASVNREVLVLAGFGFSFQSLLLTPLCVALVRGHSETAELLRSAGAVYDIFTASYTGDEPAIRKMVRQVPDIVNVWDPANDVLQTSPLYHAVFGGWPRVVRFLFEQGAEVGANSTAMVRHAANHDMLAVVRGLLRHGAAGAEIASATIQSMWLR
jgi:hypothetical protein